MAHYYVKHFLPLCVELCRPDAIPADKPAASNASKADADPSISSSADNSTSTPAFQDQGSGSSGKSQAGGGERAGTVTSGSTAPEASDQLSFFPDPTREVADHSPVARGVAYIFLKRQQVRTLVMFLGRDLFVICVEACLTHSRWTSTLLSCLWSLKDLPISRRFTPYDFLSRCEFNILTTRQAMIKFYLLTYSRFPLRKK